VLYVQLKFKKNKFFIIRGSIILYFLRGLGFAKWREMVREGKYFLGSGDGFDAFCFFRFGYWIISSRLSDMAVFGAKEERSGYDAVL